MLQCITVNSPSIASNSPPAAFDLVHAPPSQAGTSNDGTPVQSPGLNLRREYTFYVESNSYNEMYSRYHNPDNEEHVEFHFDVDDEDSRRLRLNQVLHPNREYVDAALRLTRRNTLTDIVSRYFQHSEDTTHHCLLLHQYVLRARALYDPLHKLLEILPLDLDSITQSQCQSSYEIFLHFDRFDNPFPCPDSHNVQDLRRSFSELRQQLDLKLKKSRSRVNFVRRATAASALCIIGSVVAVTVTVAAIATHTLAAIVACPFCAVANLPRKLTRQELAHLKQLDAAARGTYVLNNDLDTIDRIVARLYGSVEDDKNLIQFALASGSEKHPVSVVLKHLRKNYLNFIDLLNDLEERIYLYFNAVNRARNLLLQEIHLHQFSNS